MELLVIAVLAGAALQSILKLALIPLRWRIPLCAVAVLPALIWHDRLAAFNYQRMLQQLGSSELLATLCLGVVLQELLTLVVGWKLLDEKQQKSWRSVVLLPSILLIPGSFYLEIFCFNYLVGWNFGLTAALLAAVGAAVLLGGEELHHLQTQCHGLLHLAGGHHRPLAGVEQLIVPKDLHHALADVPAHPEPDDRLLSHALGREAHGHGVAGGALGL